MKLLHNSWLAPLGFLALMILMWEVLVIVLSVPSYLLPPPSEIWTAFNELSPVLLPNIQTTLTETILGLGCGTSVGVLIAALLWRWNFARRALFPILVTSQTIPMIVLAPLLVLWFGFGLMPKVLVVALVTFFPIAVATTTGLAGADREIIDLLRSMKASKNQIARMVLIPSALPSFFSGLRIATTYSITAAVIGEWVGASSGLGLMITRAQASFRVDRVLVAVCVIAGLSILLWGAVELIARWSMPWLRPNNTIKEMR